MQIHPMRIDIFVTHKILHLCKCAMPDRVACDDGDASNKSYSYVSSSDARRPEESRKGVTFCRNLYTCTPREDPGATFADRR